MTCYRNDIVNNMPKASEWRGRRGARPRNVETTGARVSFCPRNIFPDFCRLFLKLPVVLYTWCSIVKCTIIVYRLLFCFNKNVYAEIYNTGSTEPDHWTRLRTVAGNQRSARILSSAGSIKWERTIREYTRGKSVSGRPFVILCRLHVV